MEEFYIVSVFAFIDIGLFDEEESLRLGLNKSYSRLSQFEILM